MGITGSDAEHPFADCKILNNDSLLADLFRKFCLNLRSLQRVAQSASNSKDVHINRLDAILQAVDQNNAPPSSDFPPGKQ